MQWMRQSTQKTERFGPFLDQSDGYTPETGLTITQSDIRLSKDGGDFAQTTNAGGATHDEAGWYSLTLSASDMDTVGTLMVTINMSGALPMWREFLVVPANIYDAMVDGTDYLQTDAQQAEGSSFLSSIWTYARRTLTQPATTVLSTMDGGDLNIHRGDTFDYTWSNLSVSDVSKAWFTVKTKKSEEDTVAILQVDSDTGLLYVSRSAASDASQASMSITSTTIQVTIESGITASLSAGRALYWDLQVKRNSGDVDTLLDGSCKIVADVTRATS